MRLSKVIKAKIGEYRFLKDIKKINVKREVVGFNEALKIGLLYDATDEKDYEYIKTYVKHVRSNYKKDILAMGYVDKKMLPASQFAQYGLDFFTRKDLNYGMIPVDPIVDNFINAKFDILINLNSGKCFPLRYIAAVSNARFRVGRYAKSHTACYDMMIKMKGDLPIKNVIEEVEHFLRLIKQS